MPFVAEFELKAAETRQQTLKMVNWAGEERDKWISSDDHIHITRAATDDADAFVFCLLVELAQEMRDDVMEQIQVVEAY